MAYNTAYDLDSLMVNTKAATVYAAHENSLFLGGTLIPQVNLPAGSIVAQVPVMGTVIAERLTRFDALGVEDFTAQQVPDTKVTIDANIYAARQVLRDLGGIDPAETGRVLGNAIQAKFDFDVVSAMAGFFGNPAAPSAQTLNVDLLFDAAAVIRNTGETGALTAVISPASAAYLMKDIGSASFAGGDFQTEGLRSGFIGTVAGIRMFQSSHVNPGSLPFPAHGVLFGEDAMRIAMFKNVDLEIQRRAEAVGNDIIANLHAGVGIVDSTRGVILGA